MTNTPQARKLRAPSRSGAIAQLGERYTGSVEVGGSIPPSSTSSFATIALRLEAELLALMALVLAEFAARTEEKELALKNYAAKHGELASQTTGESEGK